MFLKLFKKKDPVDAFWQYFKDHEKELYHFRDEDTERLFKDLHKLICKVNKQLIFSMPKQMVNEKREFTISAASIGNNFPDVIQLVEAAPQMERFTIVAFNQRNDDEYGTTSNGIEINRDDVFFSYTYDAEQPGFYLELYIKGFQEDNKDYYDLALELLEMVVGEYVVGTEITEIGFHHFISSDELYPINELPNILESYRKG